MTNLQRQIASIIWFRLNEKKVENLQFNCQIFTNFFHIEKKNGNKFSSLNLGISNPNRTNVSKQQIMDAIANDQDKSTLNIYMTSFTLVR